MSDEFLSPKRAAAIVGCHEDTLKKYAEAGTVPATKSLGGWWRFKRSDLEPFIGLVGRSEAAEVVSSDEPKAAAS